MIYLPSNSRQCVAKQVVSDKPAMFQQTIKSEGTYTRHSSNEQSMLNKTRTYLENKLTKSTTQANKKHSS